MRPRRNSRSAATNVGTGAADVIEKPGECKTSSRVASSPIDMGMSGRVLGRFRDGIHVRPDWQNNRPRAHRCRNFQLPDVSSRVAVNRQVRNSPTAVRPRQATPIGSCGQNLGRRVSDRNYEADRVESDSAVTPAVAGVVATVRGFPLAHQNTAKLIGFITRFLFFKSSRRDHPSITVHRGLRLRAFNTKQNSILYPATITTTTAATFKNHAPRKPVPMVDR